MDHWFLQGDYTPIPTDVPMMLMGLLLAFVCGHAIAWVYMFTHTGLSYSKSFVNSLVVIPTIVSMVMLVLSNNLVTAFGLMAIFAIVRFRNVLRDTLDTSFILSVIVIGMACGTLKFATAIAGCMMICLIMFYIWLTSFGTRHRYDTILNLHWERPAPEFRALDDIFGRHTRRSRCVSERTVDGSSGVDFSYRLLLRDPSRMEDLLVELREMDGVSRVTGLKAEAESEV
ncbi:MAG: DUF4956 domain-containing protein [Verrucomicrobiota bacterium]|nr:DUF4956 domain-containing protein [Verrucomicrobiota bacterium]